ncbi:MAG: hypothetical protein RLY40_720 [Pseudomonadota bacterium]
MLEPAFKERDNNKQYITAVNISAIITEIVNTLSPTALSCRPTTSCTLSQ